MSELNIITANLSHGKTYVTASRYMEDYGQVLKIEGIDLPSVYQVDFSNNLMRGTSMTVLGNADGVAIPDEYISTGHDVYAFLYLTGDSWGRTIATIRIPNKTRPKRTNAIPTPTQQGIIDQTIAALNDAVESTAADAEQTASDAARAEAALETLQTASATATTLPTGSEATASYADGVFNFGIPTGATGAKGDPGNTGATPNLTIGTVTTLSHDDDATATITGTAENPVLSLGIPQGKQGEVTQAEFDALTDDVAGIETELKTTSPYNIVWQQGGLNTSGVAINRTNRIRTTGYITIENDSIFVEIPSGFKYAIHAYDSAKTRIGYIPNGSDIITDRKATYKVSDFYDNAVYFRMWVAYTDDSDILPAEGSNVTVAPFESVIASLKSHVLKSVRILGVGNSYTRDSIRWLCKILKESGYEDVIVGHGYLGASTLAEQYASLDSSDSNHSAFEYWKYSNTKNATKTSGKTLDEIFTDEPWDIVVFQQQSDESGQYASYVSSSFDINDFITYISGKVSNPDLKFGLMMPWSHSDGYTSTKFAEYYNSDPKVMLDAIKTVIPQVADHMTQCDYVVNAGEAIDLGRQNSYLNALGDQMLRTDKNHLYYGIPSYMVGLTYALTLCDANLNNVMWYPTGTDEGQTGITTSGYLAYLAKQCAFTAVNGYALADDVSDLKAEIGEKADYTDLIKAFPTDTASGAIASFSDGADDLPLKSLVVDINPVQDLHGQDAPYPAGGGKNLFDINNPLIIAATIAYITTYAPKVENGKFYNGGKKGESVGASYAVPVKAGSTYTVQFIVGGETVRWEARAVTLNGNVWASNVVLANTKIDVLGAVSFTVTIPSGYTHLFVGCYSDTKRGSWETNIQIEEGSTATSYAPYENICPISGWTEVDVEQSGINVWDEEWEVGGISNTTGENTVTTTTYRTKNYIRLIDGVDYYFYVGGSYTMGARLYDSEKNFVRSLALFQSTLLERGSQGFPTNVAYMRFVNTSTATYNHDISINYPSTDHSYHPYTGRSITIDLGQTVYGGTLDVTNGVLTTYPYYANYNGETLTGAWISDRDKYMSGATPTTGAQVVNIGGAGTDVQLDPHEVTALLGSNNIWADSGDSAVEYRADPTLYIGRLTEPDADMIADSNITSGQYFMVGNTLYKATANIASGASIVPNVNCTRKSLSEALNELNA